MNFDQRLLRLLSKSKWAFITTIALGLSGGALAIWQARLFAQVVDQAFLKQQAFSLVIPGLQTLLFVIIVRALSTWGYEAAGSAISNPIKRYLRQQIYTQVMARGPVITHHESSGELVNTTVEGVEALDSYYSQYIPQTILAIFIPIIFLIFITPVDWVSALVMLFTAPLIPVFMVLIGNIAQVMTRRQWLTLSRMSAYFLDVLQGLSTLKMLGRSREQVKKIADVSQRYAETTLGVLRVAFLSALTLELVATLSTAVVAVQLGLRLLYGWISFEEALFVLALAPEFYLPLRLLGTRFHAGIAGVEAGKRIFEVIGEEGRANRGINNYDYDEQAPDTQASVERLTGGFPAIQFKDVYFQYGNRQVGIDGVSFTINPGEKIALVGVSGAGKSTLTSLLMGFIQPTQGEITVGDRKLSDFSIEDWRKNISWVPQRPYLFRKTIAENIRLANPNASNEELIKATQLANADHFIQDMPDGYETMIGERGARLSAGQSQRIALARAFLKDASLLILDEGIAHLDPFTNAQIQESIRLLSQNRTVVIIAHQIFTITQVDRILVIDKGRIVQAGKHMELVKQDGKYRQLLDSEFNQQDQISEAGTQPSMISQTSSSNRDSHSTDTDSRISFHASPLTAHYSLLTILSRLVRLITPYSGWIILSALLGFATIGSSIGLAATSAYIISAAALQPSIAVLQVAIVGVRFFGLSRGIFRYLERYISHKITMQLLGNIRVWFYEALEPLAPARLWIHHSGDLLSRIIGDISSLENFYVRALYPPLVAVLIAILLGVYLGSYSIWLASIILVLYAFVCVGLPLAMNLLAKKTAKAIIEKRALLSEHLVDGIQGMADILIYGQWRSVARLVNEVSIWLETNHQKMGALSGLQNGLLAFFANFSLWLVLWLVIPSMDAGIISGVFLASLALAAAASFEAASPLPTTGQHLASNFQAARRLFELVDTDPEVTDPKNPLPLPGKYDLRVDGLSFGYPKENLSFSPSSSPWVSNEKREWKDGDVLHNVSFSLPQGERLTIIGPSGAGKTTIIHLLLRFWEYRQGSIYLGGKDIRQYRQDDLRKIMAVVPQNPYLFNATLLENIIIARPDASQQQINSAVQKAQLAELVASLPQGLDTWVGEQGLRLSAGERQRVAIARAFLKDAPILILDEVTANLDAHTEAQLMTAIDEATMEKSVMMVTHRKVSLKGEKVLEIRETSVKT